MVLGAIILQLFALSALSNLGKACVVNEGCLGNPKLLDLGMGFYPRFLFTMECQSKCLSYICTPQQYKVRVLQKRSTIKQDGSLPESLRKLLNKEDGSLPEPLRESWRFVYQTITVACLCSFYNQE